LINLKAAARQLVERTSSSSSSARRNPIPQILAVRENPSRCLERCKLRRPCRNISLAPLRRLSVSFFGLGLLISDTYVLNPFFGALPLAGCLNIVERAMYVMKKGSQDQGKMMLFEQDASAKGRPRGLQRGFCASWTSVCSPHDLVAGSASLLYSFYLVNTKNRGSFCELHFKSVEKFLRFVYRCVRLA